MAKLSLNNVTLAQEIDGVAYIDSATAFPAGHVIQHKLVTIAQYTESNTSNSTLVPRGLTSINLNAGNRVIVTTYIPEINKGTATISEYIDFQQVISQSQPGTTYNRTVVGNLVDDDVGIAMLYYSTNNSNARIHGLSFLSYYDVQETGTYYTWFATRSTTTFTHSIGVNAPNRMTIQEITL